MLHSPLIAIVDSDVACRDMLRELLDEEGYQVVACADGRAALPLLADRQPDVVIVDVGPAMGAVECHTQRLLRYVTSRRPTSLILCSTDPRLAVERSPALHDLSCATLTKPFHIDALLSLVRAALRQAGESERKVGDDGS